MKKERANVINLIQSSKKGKYSLVEKITGYGVAVNEDYINQLDKQLNIKNGALPCLKETTTLVKLVALQEQN